ncbi:hypothetical protein B0A48_18480 [Cryoendolithus antarcticus]|uniref:F-box domain-containing protein n=1 Tax=Cryoendolithus antarcticus TaxID=1507870 RepID=A0A1V8S7Z6_9PEZI|nr:hypothetical protein B0A48_18480 [Cryoendolithus antarcticus]
MRFAELPEELVSNISCRLGIDDVRSLRLSSKTIEEKCFHEFATEWFSSKAVHFTTDSLGVLVDISLSKRLAKYVKDVRILTTMFSDHTLSCPSGGHNHCKTTRQAEAYRFYIQDQAKLKEKGDDRRMLIEAFSNLSSLKTVGMLDADALLSAEVDYRGRFKVPRLTGLHPARAPAHCHDRSNRNFTSKEYRKWLVHVWYSLLRSLAGARNKVAINEFRTDFTFANNSLDHKLLTCKRETLAKFAQATKTASRLHLQLRGYQEGSGDGKKAIEAIKRFADCFPQLSDLTLSFDFSPNADALLRKFMVGVKGDLLTHLSLKEIYLDQTWLAKMLVRMKLLKELRLDGIDLQKGTWPTVLNVISKLEHLDHLDLMYLRENGHKAFFLKQNVNDDAEHDLDGDEWADSHNGDDEDDSDEMPDLEPVGGDDIPDLEPAEGGAPAGAGKEPTTQDITDDPATWGEDPMHLLPARTPADKPEQSPHASLPNHDELGEELPDYVPTGSAVDYGESGFYICVKPHDKIMRHLKVFIREYNIGEHQDPHDDMDFPLAFGGAGPPPPGLAAMMGPGGPAGFLANLAGLGMPPMPQGMPHFMAPPPPGFMPGPPPPVDNGSDEAHFAVPAPGGPGSGGTANGVPTTGGATTTPAQADGGASDAGEADDVWGDEEEDTEDWMGMD